LSNVRAVPNVRHIIAVASGKGGVGKSTIAVNLALALAEGGRQVGILDADIYGPSQPMMLGDAEKPTLKEKALVPLLRHGIKSMSMGYLIDENSAMIWRGPMVSMALQQLLHETEWGELDYLVLDMPPGTGDIHLTLAQKIPVTGVVIVTTPQDLALLDARRACEMFMKLHVPILGLVENMSVYHCPQCGHEEAVFGRGGGQKLANQYHMDVLNALPLDVRIREMTDSGAPPMIQEPHGYCADIFRDIAAKIVAKIATLPPGEIPSTEEVTSPTKNYASKFPRVVVEHTKKKEP
jgi:ATP-binding protein involved in chromosome partitioning